MAEDAPFYEEDESESEDGDSDESGEGEGEGKKKKKKPKKKPYTMDPDHRLLLKNAKPLLQSRNASVSTVHTSHDDHMTFSFDHMIVT